MTNGHKYCLKMTIIDLPGAATNEVMTDYSPSSIKLPTWSRSRTPDHHRTTTRRAGPARSRTPRPTH